MAEFFRHICAGHGLDSSPGQPGLTSGFVTHWVVVVLGHRKEWTHAQQVHTVTHTCSHSDDQPHGAIMASPYRQCSWEVNSLITRSFTCSLNTYYVLGTVLESWDISVDQRDTLALLLEWMF